MIGYFAKFDRKRRRSRRHRAKLGLVRDLWLIAGGIMIVMPHPAAVCALALLATFVSFVILDETS